MAAGETVRVRPAGDRAVLAGFGDQISEEISRRVMDLKYRLDAGAFPGILETVPAFSSLLICYDPVAVGYDETAALVQNLAQRAGEHGGESKNTVEIPVCYGGIYGEDLEYVAAHAGLTVPEVIRIHSGRTYRIYMLGFLPGFPYLGGLDERLFTPRLAAPRKRIPAGSVGIGGEQTGIYPVESPGGWQLIGRTPWRLFDPAGGGKLPYAAGDRVRFVPVSEQEFREMEEKTR